MQEVDAERRLDILRGSQRIRDTNGEQKTTFPDSKHRHEGERRAKKRKLGGEDDTDRDIRLAKLENETSREVVRHDDNAPLVDKSGHLNLFPQERTRAEKNDEAEKETSKKRQEFEDQYTMRFSNAAGGKEGIVKPWYSTSSQKPQDMPTKDVWGNEDPRRQLREQARINLSDPLAMMKKGVKQLKESEKQREAWKAERDKETFISISSKRRRRRSRSRDSDSSLEGFSLDNPPARSKDDSSGRHRSQHGRHRHRHKHRSRSRERSHRTHHDRNRHGSSNDRI